LTRDPKGELWSLAGCGKGGGCGCAGEPVGRMAKGVPCSLAS
jgi:hypothetical protein